MPRYTLVVSAKPIAGEDEAWNSWYDHVHLDEVLAIEGFVSAKRLAGVCDPAMSAPYLAVYGIDAEDAADACEAVQRLKEAPLTQSPAMDLSSVTFAIYRDGDQKVAE